MKMLLLLRHGKSPQGGSDWERPLTARARQIDLPLVAQYVRDQGIAPEWVISSDACRARETATAFARHFTPMPELVLTRDLYLVPSHEIADEVKALPDSVGTAVVVGHNAGLEMFAEDLLRAELPAPLKPGGLWVFQLDIESWRDLHPSRATPVGFVNPKELRG
jgi:phosphohistidine phosphatase